jgi:periplasmic divalent cation tolerance protein
MSVVFVYVTVPTGELVAQMIARTIVSEHLAACANIFPGTQSIYEWQGKIEQRNEVVLILKTQEHLYPALEARVKTLHSDETPCVVALSVTTGNTDFLQWIKTETTK